MKAQRNDQVSAAVNAILAEVAREQGCTVEELVQAAERKLKDTPGAKVTAIMTKPVTTIDGESWDVQSTTVRRTGVMKGFGKGFRDYVMKGPQQASVQTNIGVGQLPDQHPDAGKWCVQVNIYPFDTSAAANRMADNTITPLMEQVTGGKAVIGQ